MQQRLYPNGKSTRVTGSRYADQRHPRTPRQKTTTCRINAELASTRIEERHKERSEEAGQEWIKQ